jgi:hypothetical protein
MRQHKAKRFLFVLNSSHDKFFAGSTTSIPHRAELVAHAQTPQGPYAHAAGLLLWG